MKKVLITGGAGFIGSNFIRYWLKCHPEDRVINFDKLTYAGHKASLNDLEENSHYQFVQGDICDAQSLQQVMDGIDLVVHFAAESHVDRSVIDPMVFVKTNVLGTGNLLNAALEHNVKHFHHVSTDEVYGQLGKQDKAWTEESKYDPHTPYSAAKAGSDHLVRAYHDTYGLPITITNCANNYGPFHDPEKLIPRFITNLLEGKKVPLMGKGDQIREWLHVEDHARAIELVLEKGAIGDTYLIEGEGRTNLEVTKKILEILGKDESWIEYVPERLGHDYRYAINGSKLKELGWKRLYNFDEEIVKIIKWYKDNEWWWRPLKKDRPNVDRSAQKTYEAG